MILREGNASDTAAVLQIAKSLDEWFNKDGIKYIEQDLEFQKLIIVEFDSEPIGFLVNYSNLSKLIFFSVFLIQKR